jgi:hypothetical protein
LIDYGLKDLNARRYISRFKKPIILKLSTQPPPPETCSILVQKSIDYMDTYPEDLKNENYNHLIHYINELKWKELDFSTPRDRLMKLLEPPKRRW